jgi:diacylglycerol kinase family enzyme
LINDGLLHLRIFTGEELIPALFSTLANPENSPNIVDGVSSWFEITAPHEMTFNLDGEPLSGKTFRMELLPAPALPAARLPAATLIRLRKAKTAPGWYTAAGFVD